MPTHEKIDYVEFPAQDLAATKAFFTAIFGWSFEDYDADYAAFSDEGLDGGFYRADQAGSAERGSALLVFCIEALEDTLAKMVAAGGVVSTPVSDFPGSRRFHFTGPAAMNSRSGPHRPEHARHVVRAKAPDQSHIGGQATS